MKVSNIKNLDSVLSGKQVKEQGKKSPQPKSVERSSLDALSNYAKGGLNLSFRGQSVQDIKDETKKLLDESGKFSEDFAKKIVSYIQNDEESAQIQFGIIKGLVYNGEFDENDIDEIAFYTGTNKKSLKIQSDLFSDLIQNNKFQKGTIKDILCSVSANPEVAQIQKDLIDALAPIERMGDADVLNIALNVKGSIDKAKIKKSLVFDMMNDERFSCSDISNIIDNIGSVVYRNIRNDNVIDDNNSGSYDGDSKAQYDFMKMVLESDLSDNKNVISSLPLIVWRIENTTDAQKTFEILKKLNDKGLLENKLFQNDSDGVYHLSEYIRKKPDVDIEKILSYMEKIDFDKISEKAPLVKTFDFGQYLTFCDYHLKKDGKTEFDDNDLTFGKDLTEFLSDNYLDGEALTELLSAFPMTKRNVGEIPSDWLDKVPDDKKEGIGEKIYDAISEFQKDLDAGDISQKSEKTDDFSKKLSEILGKKVYVKKLGFGSFGSGYKIDVEGAKPLCFKTFHNQKTHLRHIHNQHGAHIEVQVGLFANNYSSDFVKMYFGRVAPINSKDGFLVTQFLDKETEPDNSTGANKGLYEVNTWDAEHDNQINGKIFDFGAVEVIESENQTRLKPYDIFKTV